MTRRGDEDRFEALFRDNYRRVVAYALRRATPEDAADVVAATFTIAWDKLADVPNDEGALVWLLATARRTLANEHRRRLRGSALFQRLVADLGRVTSDRCEPVDEEAVVARTAFGALSPDDQELLGLVGWEGLGLADLASVLGITKNAAGVRLHRARARFSARLAEAGLAGERSDATPEADTKSLVARTGGCGAD